VTNMGNIFGGGGALSDCNKVAIHAAFSFSRVDGLASWGLASPALGFDSWGSLECSHSPPPPQAPSSALPSSGAVVELTGAAPKIVFGSVDQPVCELRLRGARLESSCEITDTSSNSRRLLTTGEGEEAMTTAAEHEALKAEVAALRRAVHTLVANSKKKSD